MCKQKVHLHFTSKYFHVYNMLNIYVSSFLSFQQHIRKKFYLKVLKTIFIDLYLKYFLLLMSIQTI